MGTLKGMLTAFGIVLVLFGVVWFVVPGPSASERRGVAIGGFAVGVLLLVVGLL